MENKNLTLKRFGVIFLILIIIFGYMAYRSNMQEWWGVLLGALIFALRINGLFSKSEIKKTQIEEPRAYEKSTHRQYDENRYVNKDMERIYEAYNIQEEDESRIDDEELMEGDEETEVTEPYLYPIIDSEHQTTNWLLTPTGFPFALSILWLFISIVVLMSFDQAAELITVYFPVSFFIFIPILFLIGVSGFIGMKIRETIEISEMTVEEHGVYLINILKIITGWGIALYFCLINL